MENERRREIEALCREALALSSSEPDGAQERAERACGLAREVDDPLAQSRSLFALGSIRLARSEYALAEESLRSALEWSRDAGDDALAADILRALLEHAVFTRRPEEALMRGMQGLHLAERAGDGTRTAKLHNDLGLVHGRLGDFEGALDHLLEGLRLLRTAGREEDGSLLNNIGNVYLELADDREALSFFGAALDAFRERGELRQQGIALGNIGRAHARLGEHRAALDAHRRCVEAFEESGDERYLAPALARLGEAAGALGDDAAARRALARSLSVAEASDGREFLDEVLVSAGKFHLERGELRDAIDLLQRALAWIPPDETTPRTRDLHWMLAEAHERAGDLAAALRHLRAHQRVSQTVTDAETTVQIRKLMVEFDVESARQREEIHRLRNVELARANEELRALQEELEARNRELERVSVEDALTGVFNRRYLDLQLPNELARARRRDRPLSVAMCDIDHFKEINDRLSHAVGDEVLRRLGGLLRTVTREEDTVCRYGGEEFLIVMPDTDLEGAYRLVQRVRSHLAVASWARVNPELRVTLSVGLAEAGSADGAEQLLARADAMLYQAKRSGRDRIHG